MEKKFIKINEEMLVRLVKESLADTLKIKKENNAPIKPGQTIVYEYDLDLGDEPTKKYMIYWFVCEKDGQLVFFDWKGNPNKPSMTDYWRMSPRFFNEKLKSGQLKLFDSFPEEYWDKLNNE